MITRFAMMVVLVAAACGGDGEDKPTIDASPSVCGAASPVPFLGACTDNAMCGDCVCHSFGHTMACTKTCTENSECPAPSGGCTEGFCRP
jgi:hypothetical protein